MPTNIVTATFTKRNTARTSGLFQWDYGQILRFEGLDLPETYEVHFSNQQLAGDAQCMIGDSDGVDIPDDCLATGTDVYAWIFLHTGDSDGETVYMVTIPVTRRPKPTFGEPTPVQQDAISAALAVMNADASRATEAAGSAEESMEQASAAALLSRSWAIGSTGSRAGEDANNARFWAGLAQQSAQAAGYAYFDIDDETGEMLVTVTDNLDHDLQFHINEETGILEVTV